jgi:uncharacterized protein YrrD
MLLIAGSSVRGLPVVTVRGGEDVAEIKDIIYRAQAGHIEGFTLNKRGLLTGKRREVLPSEQVHAIGADAVMVLDEGRLLDPGQAPPDVAAPERDRNVIGNDVLTESGTSLGEVKDVVLLVGSSGEVVGYQIKRASGEDAYIPLPAQLAISGSALVVPDETEDFTRDDLVGLGAAVDQFRTRLGLR